MREECGLDDLSLSESLDRTFEVDGIPEHNGCCDQVKSAGPMTLVFEGAVPYLAQAVEEDGVGEGIAGFSFIEVGDNATAQGGIFHPGECRECSFHAAEFAERRSQAVLMPIRA